MVNFDLHGDGGKQSSNDKQGRAVFKIPGVLLAAFTSNHRWGLMPEGAESYAKPFSATCIRQ